MVGCGHVVYRPRPGALELRVQMRQRVVQHTVAIRGHTHLPRVVGHAVAISGPVGQRPAHLEGWLVVNPPFREPNEGVAAVLRCLSWSAATRVGQSQVRTISTTRLAEPTTRSGSM